MYFNMDHVRDTVLERVRAETSPPKPPLVDMHSAHMLMELASELTAARIHIQAVEARSSVRDRLRNEGVDQRIGLIDRFTSVADAVEGFQNPTTT